MLFLRSTLKVPVVYQAFQVSGGFFNARLHFLKSCGLDFANMKVVDVGCGPGFLRSHLPSSTQYFGFDTDQAYIAYAKRRGQANATYVCAPFTADSIAMTGPVEAVMMHGLLHHLDDDTARQLIRDAASCLGPGGCLLTLDGFSQPDQPWFRRKMLDWDRGKHVRTKQGYLDLFESAGLETSTQVDDTTSHVPYDFLCITARK